MKRQDTYASHGLVRLDMMTLSDRLLLDALSRTPFVDSAELVLILGEAHATIHRRLTDLLAEGIVGRVSHGTAHLPSSQRYYLTANGIREAAGILGFETPSDFVRAYPVSGEWLALLIRRMDAVASVYRLATTMSPGIDGLRSHVEFHRRGRFDATITLHDGRSFGVVRQGLALRRRSLYDRLRAIAEYDYTRRPDTVLILVPSVWEERLTTRFCEERNLRECFVAVESRGALERRDIRLWCCTSWVIGSRFFTLEAVSSQGSPGGRRFTDSPERKRASIPRPERMVEAAPAFGITPSEKRTLDLITDHPMIPREHLATWLGVSEGRVSQMMHNLVKTWGLIERHGKRGDVRYTLSAEGIRYITHRDRAELPTTRGIWSTALTTDKQGRRRHVGHRIETWVRQTKHADGITWFLSKLEAIRWWDELTGKGGEGMVVKPMDFIATGKRGMVQPAMKCRGPEYLRIIYGPEYTLPENIERLRNRGLSTKRSLALREFALGVEGLRRFVEEEPLYRVHECAFAVLALESEPVDPRL